MSALQLLSLVFLLFTLSWPWHIRITRILRFFIKVKVASFDYFWFWMLTFSTNWNTIIAFEITTTVNWKMTLSSSWAWPFNSWWRPFIIWILELILSINKHIIFARFHLSKFLFVFSLYIWIGIIIDILTLMQMKSSVFLLWLNFFFTRSPLILTLNNIVFSPNFFLLFRHFRWGLREEHIINII